MAKFFNLKKKTKQRLGVVIKALVVALLLWAGVVVAWAASFEIPDLDTFYDRRLEQSTKIYDRTGEVLLHELYTNARRTIIPYEEISRNVKNATIAIEDANFYDHSGIEPTSIVRAVFVNARSMSFEQGGSTITQQVVKNSLLTNEKTISRKLKEWILSLKLEREMNKDEILTLYLNEVPYGGSIYGIQEASRYFFNKDASELTLSESAYLAALPQAPTYYSPHGNNTEALEARKNLVLDRMLANEFITEEEYTSARNEEVVFQKIEDAGIKAPHFVFYIEEYLESKYGPRVVRERGLKVYTTLDWDLQKKAEEIALRYALSNHERYDAENAAMVAIDPQTGQILTMVGSRDYFDEVIPGKFNTATSHRQPGSSFKPFVYATALKKGYTPETIVFDSRTQFSTACSPSNFTSGGNCYSPVNYDDKYLGPMSLRNALAQSRNVPAVKVLYLSGLNDSLRTARDMGITSLVGADRYGLTLVLGGGEVSLLDMTSAYGVFAQEGVRNPHNSILRIEDTKGNVLEEFKQNSERVLDAQIARQISDILSDNVARTPAFGANSPLYFPGKDVAAKTGTTNDYKDAWIVGYSPSIAVGAWAGNNDNRSMDKRVAGFVVAPMWHELMEAATNKYPSGSFRAPAPSRSIAKPMVGGSLPQDGGYHSILHWVDLSNPLGPAPAFPARDPQYPLWEYPVRNWGGSPGSGDGDNNGDNGNNGNNGGNETIRINGLNAQYSSNDFVQLSVSGENISSVDVFVNNAHVGSVAGGPYNFSFRPADVGAQEGENFIRINVIQNGNSHTINRTFIVGNVNPPPEDDGGGDDGGGTGGGDPVEEEQSTTTPSI